MVDIAHVELATQLAAKQGIIPTVVLSGTCEGVDLLGEVWAKARRIPVERYPALWRRYGNFAGPERNGRMVARAEALIAVFDDGCRGTADCILQAMTSGLRVFVHNLPRSI